jgi:trehalose-phosphatase
VTVAHVSPGGAVARLHTSTYPIPSREPVDLATTMILFGIDGTTASFHRDPGAVRIDPKVMEVLEPLEKKAAILAPDTGRTAAAARDLVEPLKLPCVGQHGIEYLARPSDEDPDPVPQINEAYLPRAEPLARFIEGMSTRLTTLLGDNTIQQQGTLWTLHLGGALRSGDVMYMNASRDAVRQVVAEAERREFFTQWLRDCVVLAPGELNKGFALDWLLATPEGRSVKKVVAYDDDASGGPLFDRMLQAREAGRLTEIVRVAVVHNGGLPREFLARADLVVPGIDGVAWHMRQLLEAGG